MKSIVAVGSWFTLLALAGCDAPKGAPMAGEAGNSAEASREPANPPKLTLGPQAPEPPIIPSPVPSLPANVQEGVNRKDPGSDMASPPEAPNPKSGTRTDPLATDPSPKPDAPK